jgi:cytidylate kinase
VYGKEIKKNRKVKIYVYDRMEERLKRRKREKRSGKKDMRGMNQVKEK